MLPTNPERKPKKNGRTACRIIGSHIEGIMKTKETNMFATLITAILIVDFCLYLTGHGAFVLTKSIQRYYINQLFFPIPQILSLF